ncbi:MAG: recombination regulator RecX [Alcaligenaceae bacterium]|nr:recombination regulator RecX [Alcaligenaceae bacterium]
MSSRDSDNQASYSSLADELTAKSSESKAKKSQLSLLARAIAILSRRDHSEKELRQKLQRYTDDFDEIDSVLSRLQQENWQSDQRFVENFVQSREQRWGNQKILQALAQHELDSESLTELKEDLKDTEYQRAREVWIKRFGAKYGIDFYGSESSADYELLDQDEQLSFEEQAKERARQMRFLASRGFSADVVYKVVNSRGAPEEEY